MKKNRFSKKLLIIILTSLLIVSCGIAYSLTIHPSSFQVRNEREQTQTTMENENNSDTIATINGEKVSKKEFEDYKNQLNQNGKNYSEKDVLDKIILNKVLYKAAIDKGITVTEEEIDNEVKMNQAALKQDNNKEQAQFLEAYIKKLGLTPEQYWEQIKSTYKTTLAVSKLYDILKQEYSNNPQRLTITFNDYYANYKKELVSRAIIKTSIK